MSKTKNNSAQDPEDVTKEITQQDSYNSDNNIRCWVAQVKGDGAHHPEEQSLTRATLVQPQPTDHASGIRKQNY